MNYIREYLEKIENGEIVAGKKVIKIYKRLYEESLNKDLPFYFDEKKGERPIEFIEKFCKQSEGEIGKPIKLELFQKHTYKHYLDLLIEILKQEDLMKQYF